MTGSDLIVNILTDSGIKVCFGYPGGAVMPLYDALYRKRDAIKHIRTAHEQGAAHAADGFARASGKIGVCIATSGPGATNLVTGIATAYADSVPVLFITANVDSTQIGTDSFQEADITGITLPVCKYNWTVRDPYELATVLRKALKLCVSGRKGPVAVDVAHDVLTYVYGKDYVIPGEALSDSEMRSPKYDTAGNPSAEELASVICGASKPVIIAGGGVGISGAYDALRSFSEKTCIPVATTLMACGALPCDSPLRLGMVGKYGDPAALRYVEEADVVIAVGVRFSNRTHGEFKKDKTVIHIDSDAAELNKNVNAAYPVLGDAKAVLEELEGKCGRVFPLPEVKGTDGRDNFIYSEEKDFLLERIFDSLKKRLGDVTVVTDVGNHQMAAARLFPFDRPGRFITSGGFGTMGFGTGAAIGVKSSGVSEEVVLVTGDGSFRMSLAELSTLNETGYKILIVVVNNKALGMVRDMQKESFGRRYIATDAKYGVPDFKKAALAYGLSGYRVKNASEFENALESYIKGNKAAVIDVRI